MNQAVQPKTARGLKHRVKKLLGSTVKPEYKNQK